MNKKIKSESSSLENPTFPVLQGVDPDYLINILTKDISTVESILELIDNAVDAARDRLWEDRSISLDKYGLPSRYDGNQINIRFGEKSVTFVDNCSGISENVLAGRAFVIGSMSDHLYGIGRFGIGLKRALFRLGTRYSLRTDTGNFAAKMRFNSAHLGQADLSLIAHRCKSKGRPLTLIRISNLRNEVKYEFDANSWNENLSTILSRRYGLYIAKGFKIFVDDEPIDGFGPDIRKTKLVKEQTNTFMATENVRVFIDAGMHEDYRLSFEADYDKQKVASLTDQYGWYFVCNDRIVEVAKHEKDLGWTTRWHQEYYGFIGWVRFTARDAANLPWDTKKSAINPHSSVFRGISGELQQFAEAYKTRNKLVRNHKGCPEDSKTKTTTAQTTSENNTTSSNTKAATTSNQNKSSSNTHSGSQGNSQNGASAADHNENWQTLLPAMNAQVKHQKVKALIYEASTIEIQTCYAASMLFRSIIELSLFEHLKSTGSFQATRQMVFDRAVEDGREFTAAQKKNFRPTFTQVLDWLNKNDDYFPDDVRRECITARNKFGKHLKELNGIVHEGDLTSSGKLTIARNDTMPLLNFLLRGI